MSTELGRIENTGSRGGEMMVTRYFGGTKVGPCLQLSAQQERGDWGYVQLSASDIVALMPVFKGLIDDALTMKKREADEAIAEYRELAKTIVKDRSEVCAMAIAQPVFDVAAILSFGKKELLPPSGD